MKTERLTSYQIVTGMVGVLLVKSFHTFPRGFALSTLTAAPWMVLVVGAAAFLLFWPVASALASRPEANLIDLALEAGGRPMAIGVTLLLTLYMIAANGMSLRQVSEMAITAVYPHTPQTWIMGSLVLAGVVGASLRLPALVWIGMSYALPTVIALLVVVVGNIPWGQFANVTPLSGPGILPLAGETLPLTSYFTELFYLTVNAQYLGNPRRIVAVTAWILGITSLIWALILLAYLMAFPLPGALGIPFPVYEMTRLLQGGRFLERVDAVWILFWSFGSAGRLAAGLMFGAILFRDTFRLPDHREAVLPLAIAVMTAALFPSSQSAAIDAETDLIRRWGFLIALALPTAVAVLAQIRRSRRKHAEA